MGKKRRSLSIVLPFRFLMFLGESLAFQRGKLIGSILAYSVRQFLDELSLVKDKACLNLKNLSRHERRDASRRLLAAPVIALRVLNSVTYEQNRSFLTNRKLDQM